MSAFRALESLLDAAARGHDAGALDALLAADFELRNAARPGVPVPRAEFIEQMRARQGSAARIDYMAVRDLGPTVIVSFLMRYGADAAHIFVVDVWQRLGPEDWRLQVRYAGAGGAGGANPDVPLPGGAGSLPRTY